jgi:hypothetical protein
MPHNSLLLDPTQQDQWQANRTWHSRNLCWFHMNQKGYLIYSTGSHQTLTSDNVIFDEGLFSSTIATTWQLHKDSLAVKPVTSYIPDVTATIEHTGTIADLTPRPIDEGKVGSNEADEEHDTPSLCDTVDDDFDEFDDEALMPMTATEEIDQRWKLPSLLTQVPHKDALLTFTINATSATTVEWANVSRDVDLLEACAVETHQHFHPSSEDAHSWEPAPGTIRGQIEFVRRAWLASVEKELKTLFNTGTFVIDTLFNGEISVAVMQLFKVKINSDGCLDKLKTRLVVCGNITEDKWSPTASFHALKMFLAHASKMQVRVRRLDFIGAFLQAKTRSRIFVMIPKIFGILLSEHMTYCGKPVRLAMSMYGTTLSGKYWYLVLQEHLLELGFKASESMQCLFIKLNDDSSKLCPLNYADDMLYYRTSTPSVNHFQGATAKAIQRGAYGPSAMLPIHPY